jgi:threonine dehydrogenase-like Zn-dependent dehydrogenase
MDAIIRVSAACVCGSDLWPYRGIEELPWPAPMGHEYAGIVEEVGDEVETIKPGQFVVGSFWATDNTCEICRTGYQSAWSTACRSKGWGPRPSCYVSRLSTAP